MPSGVGHGVGVGVGKGVAVGTGDGHGVHVGAGVAVGGACVAVAVGVGQGVGVADGRDAALQAASSAMQRMAATSGRLWVDDLMASCLQVVGEGIAGGGFCQIGPWRVPGAFDTRAARRYNASLLRTPRRSEREEATIRNAKPNRTRRTITLILGTLLSLLFLWLAFRQVHLREVWDALRQANPWLVGAALGAFLATQGVKAARWKALFYPEHTARRFGKLLRVIYIGQMVNAALPARLGEIARAYLLARIEAISAAYALGTVVLEKALDSLMLLLVVLVTSIFMPFPSWVKGSSLVVSGGMVALLAAMTVLSRWEGRLPAWVVRVAGPDSWLGRMGVMAALQRAALSLRPLKSLRMNLILWGWSAGNWALMILTNLLAFWAFGLRLPWTAAPLLLAILNIGIIVPSSPGRIGVFHYLCVLTLGLYGVDPALALACGIVLHALVYVPIFVLGAYFLWRENYDWSRLAELAALENP